MIDSGRAAGILELVIMVLLLSEQQLLHDHDSGRAGGEGAGSGSAG
jgi:hypothetical protein